MDDDGDQRSPLSKDELAGGSNPPGRTSLLFWGSGFFRSRFTEFILGWCWTLVWLALVLSLVLPPAIHAISDIANWSWDFWGWDR